MANYFFVMGYPHADDENAAQMNLFAALQRNKGKAPVPLTVYLIETRRGRLLTVCEWPEGRMSEIEEKGGLWGDTSIFRQWVERAAAPMYQDADILGPRTHGVQTIDGPSRIVLSFTTGWGVEAPLADVRRDERAKIGKWLKFAFLAALLIGSGYFFGTICRQMGQAYELIFSPSGDLLSLLLWLLLALAAMMASSGLVAALLRPAWVAVIAFALSGVAMFVGWEVALINGGLVLVYLAGAFLYVVSVTRDLNERIRFSLHAIDEGQVILQLVLVLVVCGSLYRGYAAYVEREGFSIPEFYVEKVMEQVEKRVEDQVSEEDRQEAVAGFREQFLDAVNQFEQTMQSFEWLAPLALAASLFMPLILVARLLGWISIGILRLIFPLLSVLKVTEVVRETREVQRLVIR